LKKKHSTIEKTPETILKNWYKPIRLKTGSIRELPPPPEESREFTIKFLEWLRTRREYSPNSLHRYLVTLRKVVSWLGVQGKSLENMTYEDYLEMYSDLREQKLPETLKLVLKYLYFIAENEKYLKLYGKIKVKEKKARMVDVLSEDQVYRLFEACSRIDFELKVLVEVVYETGARVGEILSLRRKDIEFDRYGARIYIRKSKSEFRCVRVVLFATDLLRLCEPLDEEEHLFQKEYNSYLEKLRKAWKLAGLPPIRRKFHILRHSRATELLKRRIFTEQEMMKWFGWKTRKMIDVYSHITMEDVEARYLSALSSNFDNKEFNTKHCPRCGLPLDNSFNYCPRCGQPLSSKASLEKLLEAQEKEREVEEAKKLIDKLLELALKNPTLIKRLLGQADQL